MTTFVVLAAGRGSRLGRIGDALPKCLLPLNGRAILSHQFALAPTGARLVVVTGYRHEQVEEYVRLAHPSADVTLVHEENWGRGPGASLLEARDVVGDDDLVFTACDTLWDRYDDVFDCDVSWVAVAPVPAGTPDARWCRIKTDVSGEFVEAIYDKVPDVVPNTRCWTALARIAREDLAVFWEGLEHADGHAGELQLSAGLNAVVKRGQPLEVQHVEWLDVGDEQSFRQATATLGGYNSLKPNQVTYVDTTGRRVVKFHVDRAKIRDRVARAKLIGDAVPSCVESFNGTMTAYDYVEGQLAYDAVERRAVDTLTSLFDWWHDRFWVTHRRYAITPPVNRYEASSRFYRDKTFERVMALDPMLRNVAFDVITRVDWEQLADDVVPGVFHGDFTLANVVVRDVDGRNVEFKAIDWREDYAGVVEWGDLRYDLAKLLTSARFHWQRASYGDFRRWESWGEVESIVESQISLRFPSVNLTHVRIIAALCLLNSAVLHEAPMDEILVARGTHWLESLT